MCSCLNSYKLCIWWPISHIIVYGLVFYSGPWVSKQKRNLTAQTKTFTVQTKTVRHKHKPSRDFSIGNYPFFKKLLDEVFVKSRINKVDWGDNTYWDIDLKYHKNRIWLRGCLREKTRTGASFVLLDHFVSRLHDDWVVSYRFYWTYTSCC